MADSDGFKLPGSSYEELVKIIHAWGLTNGSASNDVIGRMAGIDASTISRNNGFLESVGILQSEGRQKVATQLGRKLANAVEHRHDEELTNCWRDAVDNSKFLQDTVAAVRIRHGMDDAALERHIGFNAGQPSNAKTRAGIRTVIQVLERSGHLTLSGDKYHPTSRATGNESPTEPTPTTAASKGATTSVRNWTDSILSTIAPSSTAVSGEAIVMQINVNVEISVTPRDLPALGRALRELQQQLREPSTAEVGPGELDADGS